MLDNIDPKYEHLVAKIFVNGHQFIVPKYVDCAWAGRGAIGCPRGFSVFIEGGDEPILFEQGYEFDDGERFELHRGERFYLDADRGPREDWEQDSDWWKRG